MATYYRWRKSTVEYTIGQSSTSVAVRLSGVSRDSGKVTLYYSESVEATSYGNINLSGSIKSIDITNLPSSGGYQNYNLTEFDGSMVGKNYYFSTQTTNIPPKYVAYVPTINSSIYLQIINSVVSASYSCSISADGLKYSLETTPGPGTSQGYVYSTSSTAYPNGGVQGGYYYDQRTTVTSPTAPTGLTYPNPITTPTVTVSWDASTSNVPDISIKTYYLTAEYFTNNNKVSENINVGNATQYQYNIVPGTTSITFQVWAIDNNNQPSAHTIGSTVPVYLAPTLTVPQMVMQGQQVTINWTAISGADSYTVQRKANTDADWVQVYSGPNLTFTETVGAWTSVQYQVQAVFSSGAGGWATSASIPVVSASALVISGTDGDLGTVVNDIPYSISTDTGNQITAKITVNSAVIFSGNVGNSTSDVIPVLDLVNGEGTIVIEASVTASSGPVSAVRTWTYTKSPITFPNAGSAAQLTQQGANIWPKTLAECVRLPGGKTLDEVMAFPCQVYIGSYTGTGTSGAANPCVVNLPFKPLAFTVSLKDTGSGNTIYGQLIWLNGNETGGSYLNSSNTGICTLQWGETSVSWYSSAANFQLNVSGYEYQYMAIG